MFNIKSLIMLFVLLCLPGYIMLGQDAAFQNRVIKKGNIYYLSNVIHIKLKHEPVTLQKTVELSSLLKSKLQPYGIKNITRTFSAQNNSLNRIITIEYSSSEDPFTVSSKLNGQPDIDWAEPHYVYKTDFIPNDPQISQQPNLNQIRAEAAWDITKGDTSVIIGIVDTGVDWTHPDLSANIWINRKEIPNNGIDDDHNGYVDDVRGWDFGGTNGTPDNDPNEDRPDHGTHVAGIASAVTNNAIGISSIGFNCKIMAVKTSSDNNRDPNDNTPLIVFGFNGIVYAADNGAKIINCSWGGAGFSRLGQDVVNYAISKGSLIVAAAGNSGNEDVEYPASYEGVISVASVGANDRVSGFSSFGFNVDVSAPGENIYSTWKGNAYTVLQGTSMATPHVAGLAGLVASRFPNFTPLQIGEQVRVNTDNIDNLNPSNYANKTGSGRINALKAVTNTNSISVRAFNIGFSENTTGANNDGFFQNGEIVNVAAKFINFLNPVDNLTITLVSEDPFTTILNPTLIINHAAELDSFNNFTNPFQFRINDNTPNNTLLIFQLKYSSGSYTDYQWLSVLANPTFRTQNINNISLTLTSKGALGFNDYPDNIYGQGFRFRGGPNLLFEGAFMFGNSQAKVSDAARLGGNRGQSTDFHTVIPLSVVTPGSIAAQQGFTSFSDSTAPSMFNILTNQYSYSFSNSSDNNYIILRYKLVNESPDQITNLFAGLFLDWDMIEGNGNGDKVSYDPDVSFGYAFHDTSNPGVFVGCALLSKGDFNMYGILNSGQDGGIEIYNDFSDAEKYFAMSAGLAKTTAGPGDISMVAAGGPYNINSHDSLNVAFSLGAGRTFQELQKVIQASRLKYHSIDTSSFVNVIPADYKLNDNYPNPFNSTTTIVYSLPVKTFVQLKVYDILGNEIATLVNTEQQPDRYTIRYTPKGLASGIYIYRLITNGFTGVKKMIYMK